MVDTVVLHAFFIGIVSACSLPLGALTSFYWKPDQRIIAALMAFGAGALLAALTIDLVGSALAHGHFNPLAIGAIIGGLLFIGLDDLVANFGGYKRKISTSLHFRNLGNVRKLKKTLTHLGRSDLFQNLKDKDVEFIAQNAQSRFYARGSTVYSEGDPSDELYVVAEGKVELRGSEEGPIQVGKDDVFGRYALLSGSPHVKTAKVLEDAWITVIQSDCIRHLLHDSEEYRASVLQWLESGKAEKHLIDSRRIEPDEVTEWAEDAKKSLREEGRLPAAVPVRRESDDFMEFSDRIERVRWLEDLGAEEAEALSWYLIYKEFKQGETLFDKGDPADYLYIIHKGEVLLSDPQDKNELPGREKEGDAIGSRAFLCGLRHTVRAQVTKDCKVWALKRHDMGKLLKELPSFRLRLLHYLKEPMLSAYQQQRYGINQGKVLAWTDQSVKALRDGRMPPSMLEMGIESAHQHGAALAIWMGILLDGIPESLVIGANMLHGSISLSLVAGLFLSNYPEALSSSFGMRDDGMSKTRIVIMWSSIMVFTGLGAALGNVFMQAADPHWFSFLEGLAAGAMLTMIAQTMLPEAYHKGGSITGFATLMGFLCTISLKVIGE